MFLAADRMPPAGPVVAIDPQELEAAARICTGDGVDALLSYLALYGAADGIELPPEVHGQVTVAVQQAARRMWELSSTLDYLGDYLRRKVKQVRLADGDQGALLAMDLAPVLRFTKGEEHWLEDPAFFLRHSRPVDGGYRDLDDRFHHGSNNRAKNLYQWDPATRQLTFWFFYAYNDGTNNHEGDWERATIRFGRDGKPYEMHFSGHSGSRTVDWDDVETDPHTGQPVVYVSKGSHAVVSHPGDWKTGAKVPVMGVEIPAAIADDDAHGDGARLDLSTRPATDVTRQSWYPRTGPGINWGDNHSVPDLVPESEELNGPPGPSPEKGHLP